MKFWKNTRGVSGVEYGILLLFLGGVATGTILFLGQEVNKTFVSVETEVEDTLLVAQNQTRSGVSDAANSAEEPATVTFDTSTATMNGDSVVLPDGRIGNDYLQDIRGYAQVTGAEPSDLVWSVSGGAIPEGVDFYQTGFLYGTPSAIETATFTVTVTEPSGANESQDFEVTILDSLAFNTSDAEMNGDSIVLNSGFENNFYTDNVSDYAEVYGVNKNDLLWSISAGSLPAGVEMGEDGYLEGTPTEEGVYTFTAKMEAPGDRSKEHDFEITIEPEPVVLTFNVVVDPQFLSDGTINTPYSDSAEAFLTATGVDKDDLTWTMTNGSLPSGVSLTNAGLVEGTPSETGVYVFEATVTAPTGESASLEYQITFEEVS